jgi:subtilisin family serine protease
VAASLERLGGRVKQRYENVEALAADIPAERLTEVLAAVGSARVVKDTLISPPRPIAGAGGVKTRGLQAPPVRAAQVRSVSAEAFPRITSALPADYNFNNGLIGATALHAQGLFGDGVVVAVIDTGVTNQPDLVPALAGSVIGGESFQPTDPVTSPTSHLNDPHGTEVGTVIAGHAFFVFPDFLDIVPSLNQHAPDSIVACPATSLGIDCPAGNSVVPLIGVAPAASLYALKVFPSNGDGAETSTIVAAMDRAITLKRNFNRGRPSVPVGGTGTEDDPFRFDSLNIQVVNMSLGGGTLFAGGELEDRLTQKMLAVGITVTTSAGNDGFAAMTGGSPGTGLGALTVGAASTAAHERILRDVQFGFGFGDLYRPFAGTQTAFFSSRGPTADGRFDPEVTANGFGTFVQDPDGSVSLVSGTSFSSPTAAGVVALLRQAMPHASAIQLRNAVIQSADRHALADGSGRIDQGRGLIDAAAALELLRRRRVDERLSFGLASPSVALNVGTLGFFPALFRNDRFQTRVKNLLPGEVSQIFLFSDDQTDRFVISLKNIRTELPPEQQNVLFGDDLFVNVADAPTSFLRDRGNFFTVGAPEVTFNVDNPQHGLVRLAISGDWTNAGRISADVQVERQKSRLPRRAATGRVTQGELVPFEVEVPAGTTHAVFELFWRENWSHYPTDDLDMFVVAPDDTLFIDGVTADSPERQEILNPPSGTWTVFVQGFTIQDRSERFTLRVTTDSTPIPD